MNRKKKRIDTDEELGYNPANDTVYTYSYNSQDQLEAETVNTPGQAEVVKSYAHDIYGNQTAEYENYISEAAGSGPKRQYTWDAENRVAKARLKFLGKSLPLSVTPTAPELARSPMR